MATKSVLYAAAKEISTTCEARNRDYVKCKSADAEPSACLHQGEQVQLCVIDVLKSAMATCEASFTKYASCLDSQISEEYMFERCRKQEADFTQCRHDATSKTSPVVAAAATESHAKPEGADASGRQHQAS